MNLFTKQLLGGNMGVPIQTGPTQAAGSGLLPGTTTTIETYDSGTVDSIKSSVVRTEKEQIAIGLSQIGKPILHKKGSMEQKIFDTKLLSMVKGILWEDNELKESGTLFHFLKDDRFKTKYSEALRSRGDLLDEKIGRMDIGAIGPHRPLEHSKRFGVLGKGALRGGKAALRETLLRYLSVDAVQMNMPSDTGTKHKKTNMPTYGGTQLFTGDKKKLICDDDPATKRVAAENIAKQIYQEVMSDGMAAPEFEDGFIKDLDNIDTTGFSQSTDFLEEIYGHIHKPFEKSKNRLKPHNLLTSKLPKLDGIIKQHYERQIQLNLAATTTTSKLPPIQITSPIMQKKKHGGVMRDYSYSKGLTDAGKHKGEEEGYATPRGELEYLESKTLPPRRSLLRQTSKQIISADTVANTGGKKSAHGKKSSKNDLSPKRQVTFATQNTPLATKDYSKEVKEYIELFASKFEPIQKLFNTYKLNIFKVSPDLLSILKDDKKPGMFKRGEDTPRSRVAIPSKININKINMNDISCVHLIIITKNYGALKEVNLSQNPIGDIAGNLLVSILAAYANGLISLKLSETRISTLTLAAMKHMFEQNKLAPGFRLNISKNYFRDEDICKFSIGISRCNFLNYLDLSDNSLSETAMTIFSTIVKYDRKIRVLDLSGNPVHSDVIYNLMTNMGRNNVLKILKLRRMAINDEHIKRLKFSLTSNSTLLELLLDENQYITNASVAQFIHLFARNSTLLHIGLSNTSLDTSAISRISKDKNATLSTTAIKNEEYYKSDHQQMLVSKAMTIE